MADASLLASAREKLQKMKLHKVDDTYHLDGGLFEDLTGHIRSIKNFDLQDGDVLLCGFPRSGNHWMFEILHMILDDAHGYTERIFANSLFEIMVDADNIVKTMEKPRVFATHVTPNFLPKAALQKNVKTVYVFRNPKDVMTSLFKTTTNIPKIGFTGSWDEYFELQLIGEYAGGSWFNHLNQWNQFIKEKPGNFFTSQFEKLREDPQAIIADLCRFLGKSESLAERIAELTSFDKMNSATKEKQDNENKKWSSNDVKLAMVKGQVNSWKNKFSVAQNERFNVVFNRYVEGNLLMEKVKPYI